MVLRDHFCYIEAMARKVNEKFQEDMMYGKKAYKRTDRDTIDERDQKGAYLHDLGSKHRVIIEWDLNQQAMEDQVFKLTIGKNEAYLSATEIQKYLRWV